MLFSSSSLNFSGFHGDMSIWSAATIGALVLASSYSLGVREGKKKRLLQDKTTGTAAGKTCPFSGQSSEEPKAMGCPFSGGSSSNDRPAAKKNTVLKTYKFNVSPEHLAVIKATLPLVAEAGTNFTKHFYARLFKENPELKNLFNQTNQAVGHQPKRLFNLIAVAAMAAIEAGEISGEMVEGVAQKHVALGVPAAAYGIVGATILETIKDLLTKDQAVLDAWGALYGEIANIFIEREAEIYATVGWQGRRRFRLVNKSIKSDTITRFEFRPVDERPVPSFEPGQFTTVWVKVPDGSGVHGEFQEQPRHYTLAVDAENNNKTLSISVKRDGLISHILHKAEIGAEFDLSPPTGCFALKEPTAEAQSAPVVFLSAGVGVTPVLAMLEDLSTNDCPVSWLHGTQNGNQHAYRDRVRHLTAMKRGDMNCRVWYSHPTEADGRPGTELETCPSLFNLSKYHYQGRMDLKEDEVEPLLFLANPATNYYMCGPKGFMEAQEAALKDLGVDANRIHSEGF